MTRTLRCPVRLASSRSALLVPPYPDFLATTGLSIRFYVNDPGAPCGPTQQDNFYDFCLFPGRPPSPPPSVLFSATLALQGYSTATFGSTEQASFKTGLAAAVGVTADAITITSVSPYNAPPPPAGGRRARILLQSVLPAAGGVRVAFTITCPDSNRMTALLQARRPACIIPCRAHPAHAAADHICTSSSMLIHRCMPHFH